MAGDRLAVILVKTAGVFFRVIPLSWGIRIASAIGTVLFWVEPRRKFIGFANMSQALGGRLTVEQRLSHLRRLYQNMAVSAVEILRFPELTSAEIQMRIRFNGMENLSPFLNKEGRNEKAWIVITAHFGNWELLGQAVTLCGTPLNVVARNQKMSQLNQLLNEFRQLHGARVIAKGMSLREVFSRLEKKETVAMLIDQDGGKRGIFAPLFDRPASVKPGAFLLSMKTGVPLVPLFITRDPFVRDRHTVEIEEPIPPPKREEEIPAAVACYLKVLQKRVEQSPQEWFWLHNRWKSSPLQKIVVLSDGKKGHLKQSLAVAESTKRELKEAGRSSDSLEILTLEVRFKSLLKRVMTSALLTGLTGSLVWRWRILKWGLTDESYRAIEAAKGDVVISAGSSLSSLNAWLGRSWHARNIHLMRPNLVPWSRFQKIILPSHDWHREQPPPQNVHLTLVSPSFPGEKLRECAGELQKRVADSSRPKIGILLGGDNDRYKISSAWVDQLLEEILKGAARTGKGLLVTTSRRSSGEVEEVVERRLKNHPRCDFLEIANRSGRDGIVEGILGLSEMILVTGESLSMVSEAVASGKPVAVIFPPARRRGLTKHQRMVDSLEKEGLVRVANLGEVAALLSGSER